MAVNLPPLPELYPVPGIRLGTSRAQIRKQDRRDLVVIECAPGTQAAALFTQNRFCAAPVTVARGHLAKAAPRALLINTARGSLIDETALIAELSTGRIFAFLDVTEPEPPALDSPLRRLDNVVVMPHIAGCIENCTRMGELAVEELRRFFAGEPAIYEIRREMLDRMA